MRLASQCGRRCNCVHENAAQLDTASSTNPRVQQDEVRQRSSVKGTLQARAIEMLLWTSPLPLWGRAAGVATKLSYGVPKLSKRAGMLADWATAGAGACGCCSGAASIVLLARLGADAKADCVIGDCASCRHRMHVSKVRQRIVAGSIKLPDKGGEGTRDTSAPCFR